MNGDMGNKYLGTRHKGPEYNHQDWICLNLNNNHSLECRGCVILSKGPETQEYFTIREAMMKNGRNLVPNGECPWVSTDRPKCPFYK